MGLPIILLPQPAAAEPSVPSGFVLEKTTTPLGGVGSFNLTGINYVPPSTGVQPGIFGAGKDGKIAWIPDSGTSRILGTVGSVRNEYDCGLLSVTPALDYATSGRVYVLYVRKDVPHSWGALAAWKVNSVANPTSIQYERLVVDGKAGAWWDDSPNHQVGDIVAWPDGSLFFSQGDDTRPTSANVSALRAQDINDPHGKIFRVLPDGKGVSTNPFYDAANPTSWKSRVYAYGVRNGFRMWRDANNGKLAVGIVGWNQTEEVSFVQSGGNYGWPCWEGAARTPDYQLMPQCQQIYATKSRTTPLWTYPHDVLQASVTGGVVYKGAEYPAQYRNMTFVGDFARQELWVYGTNGTTLTQQPIRFATGIGSVTAVRTCQGGDLCWSDIENSTIYRLRYVLGNRSPVADATFSVDAVTGNVSFDASASYDPDGDLIAYLWRFGDGAIGTGQKPTHRYTAAGPFTVTLTVTDSVGNNREIYLSVSPLNNAPVLRLTTPTAANFAVGDAVNVTATVTDAEDGVLPASGITWAMDLMHCPFSGPCHVHPSGTGSGSSFNTTFPDHGGDTNVVITATSPPDRSGVTSKVIYKALPRLRTLTVNAPAGVQVSINGDNTSIGKAVAKAITSVAVPSMVGGLPFQRWSDGVTTATRSLTMPDNDLTLTAIYGVSSSPINQRYVALGGSASWLGTPTGDEFTVGAGSQRNYQYGSLYWTAATGVHAVKGAILWKYQGMGGPTALGFPITDELTAVDGVGRYVNFQNSAIYWTSATGPHEIHGGIRAKWNTLGAEHGALGYPLTEEFDIPIGRRLNFQHGYITWNRTTGATVVVYS